MAKTSQRVLSRLKRKARIQKKVRGTGERPRLTIFMSGRHIYAQVINDELGVTLASASTLVESVKNEGKALANRTGATTVGKAIAVAAIANQITSVVFDRNGYLYHGKVKALADAAREAGLDF